MPEIAGAIDLLPTLTAMAGIPRVGDKPLDGKNISPLLTAKKIEWPERMIFSHQNGKVSVRTKQYRLDSTGALFDMAADSGLHNDIAREKSEMTAKLSQAVAAWRKEVFSPSQITSATKGKKNNKTNADISDNRPYPIGYVEFPRAPLPARDGIPHGGIRRSASAPNCSYFVNWASHDDSMTWDIEAATAGNYAVEILYTCSESDAGAEIEMSFNKSKLTGKVTPGFDSPIYTNQDTIPRPAGESRMKEFRTLNLGTIQLEKGRGPLTLRALNIPGKSVMDVRQVTLTLKNN